MFAAPQLFIPSSRPAVTASWTPASLGSALKFWVKLTDGVTGDPISALADQSGNGINLSQASGPNQPDYQATGFNSSYPTAVYTASQQHALDSASNALAFGVATMSVFVVGTMTTSTQAYGRIVSFNTGSGDNGATSAFCITRNNVADELLFFSNGSIKFTLPITAAANSRFGWVCSGSAVAGYLNGSASGTAGAAMSNTLGTGALTIGNENGGPTGWDGKVCEVLITNTAVDATTITNMDNYFKSKWGL